MIEINLLPEHLRKKETVRFELPDLPTLRNIILGVAVFFILQILIVFFALYQQYEVSNVTHKTLVLKAEIKETLLYKSETDSVNTKLKQIAYATHRNFSWASLLNEITASATKGVWLRELSQVDMEMAQLVSKTKDAKPAVNTPQRVRCLRLVGSAVGQGQETAYIGKFVKQIKENPRLGASFSRIELTDVNQRKLKDFDAYDFEVICVFKKEMAGGS